MVHRKGIFTLKPCIEFLKIKNLDTTAGFMTNKFFEVFKSNIFKKKSI